ncbi:hypothetical protein OX283_012670 [Flavobacterium sp. SUN052]|nr:hypothetical protein [Flavobacterium sp. SUN052]MEC4005516.1 hypothetical protein [Flavobacterium sp. SUN052]
MKIILTVSQIKKLLENQPAHFPITIIMKGIDREELKEIAKLLKKKKD